MSASHNCCNRGCDHSLHDMQDSSPQHSLYGGPLLVLCILPCGGPLGASPPSYGCELYKAI